MSTRSSFDPVILKGKRYRIGQTASLIRKSRVGVVCPVSHRNSSKVEWCVLNQHCLVVCNIDLNNLTDAKIKKTFSVPSSTGKMNYEVVFARRHGVYLTSCTCKAGENGMWCKHRTQLLDKVSRRGLEELIELLQLRDEIDRQKQQIVAKLQERKAECNEAIKQYCTSPGSI